MSARPSARPADPRFAALIDNVADFDLLTFDFHDPHRRDQLRAGPGGGPDRDPTVEDLKAYQRLYRVLPHSDRHGEWARHDLDRVATALIGAGLTSAHHIAELAEHQFVRDHKGACLDDERLAGEIHHRATQVRAHVRHVAANLRDVVASGHFRATLGAAVDPTLVEQVTDIPGYQDLFGGLDYYRTRDCESIFGPAAYFLDLMRITDRYITDPNLGTVPPGFGLRDRRPDLFTRKLTCAATVDPVPTVRLVNEILAARVGGAPWERLATAPYPFGLPFNRPLLGLRTALDRAGSGLPAVAASLLAPDPAAPGYASFDLARTALGLSPEQVLELTTVNATDEAVGAQFGLADASTHLPALGAGTVAHTAGGTTATGGDGQLGDLVAPGRQFAVAGQVRTVVARVSADTVEVDVPWPTTVEDARYTVFPTEDLSRVSTFTYRTGLDFDELNQLFRQGLSTRELAGGRAGRFFINDTGEESLPDLRISQDDGGDTANPVARVVGLSARRLDRLSRFIRLSAWTGVPYETLDWLLRATGAAEITDGLLSALASVNQLAASSGLPVADVAAFVTAMKTSGRGDGPAPADMFDRVFNAPAFLRGGDPRTAATPLPFDPERPLSWPVGAGPDWMADTGTVRGATGDTVTLAESADPHNGAYLGLVVTVTSGTGAGQARAVRSWSGDDRVATLDAAWDTVPDTTSGYAVTVAAGLTDRLAAALRVSKPDLDLLGGYLHAGLGLGPGVPVPLTVEHLTALWRLAVVTVQRRLTVDAYLTARGVLDLPAAPPLSPAAAIADAQATFAGLDWLAGSSLSANELRYVLDGTASRDVRVTVRADAVPDFVNRLAVTAAPALVRAATFAEAGMSPADADQTVADLRRLGHLDGRGVTMIDRKEFDLAADGFPVTTADLTAGGTMTSEEARAAIGELCRQRPAFLVAGLDRDSALLSADYDTGAPLEFLFRGVPDPGAKRDRVTAVLDGVAARVRATMYAALAPVDAGTAFVAAGIGQPQSDAVFDVLRRLDPPVLVVDGDQRTGLLSADYTDSRPLPGLFESASVGQTATITSYSGATRTATVDAPWQVVPDAFSWYEVRQIADTGATRDSTPGSVQLAESAADSDDAYAGMRVRLADGSWRTITRYLGATRTATLDRNWPTPDPGTAYTVYTVAASGNAWAGTENGIVLAPDSSTSDDAYAGMRIDLLADPQQVAKVATVRAALAAVGTRIGLVTGTIAAAAAAQVAQATQALASFVSLPVSRVSALLPYAGCAYRVTDYLPDLLTPVPGGTAPPVIVSLVTGLGRTQLAASRSGLTDVVLGAVARRPDRYGIDSTHPLHLPDLRRLTELRSLVRTIGDDATGLVAYLDTWTPVVGVDGKRAALAALTGWPDDQIGVLGDFLAAADLGWPGIDTLPGVVRLQAPFGQLTVLGADGTALIDLAETIRSAPLGPVGGTVDAAGWRTYQDAAESALTLLGTRFAEPELATVTDELAREVEAGCRDALLGFTIWQVQRDIPTILDPADLFQYLLVDVEMSGCDTTSAIAQGIDSVQLYMQRARMGFEPGVTTGEIDESWWEWLSSYRLWEANRRVFLYPENYIDPSLRRSASPEYAQLVDDLRQRPPTEEAVAKAMSTYFQSFETISTLVHVGGHRLGARERENDQVDETTHLVARTNTTPYRYYLRSFTRSRLIHAAQANPTAAESVVWEPWRKVDATIDAPSVTPVFVFDRLFLLWNETQPVKSSAVRTTTTQGAMASKTQSVWQSTLRCTFLSATGEWVSAQEIVPPLATLIAPNDYPPTDDGYVKNAYGLDQSYWTRPWAQALSRGLPAAGTLSLTPGFNVAKGTGTVLERQVHPGDRIWVAGQVRTVRSVAADTQQLTVDRPFTVDADTAPFKVLPRDVNATTFPPFAGPGTVKVSEVLTAVTGVGTRFRRDLVVGDAIQVDRETRTVASIFDDTTLTVDREWSVSTDGNGDPYNVIPRTVGAEQLLVLYGANLDVLADLPTPTNSGQLANREDDPFIANTNTFNANLYGALNLARNVKSRYGPDVRGDVAAQPAVLLGNSLDKRTVRGFAAGYLDAQAATSPYVRVALDRQNRVLFVRPESRPMVAAYWGDSTPGSSHNQLTIGTGDRPLLYHLPPEQTSVFGVGNQFGWFLVNAADQSFLVTVEDPGLVDSSAATFVRPLWQPGAVANVAVEFGPYTTADTPFDRTLYRCTRMTTGVGRALQQRLYAGGFDSLLSLASQSLPEPPFTQFYELPDGAPPPAVDDRFLPTATMDFVGPFGSYFWEIFFHAPLLVAEQLKLNQDFAAAKRWYEYIFNPNAPADGGDGPPNSRYWRFRPFREQMTIPGLARILTDNFEITTYNDDPFDPEAIARLRISAFAKTVVTGYVDNLIRWGDWYFTQDTRESIAQATNLYMLARDIMGPRPQVVGEFPPREPKSFDEISADYPAGIPQFLIELENSAFAPVTGEGARYSGAPVNDLNAYFRVPENSDLVAFWDRIDDRLFKIRHCQNIAGVERTLALFAPPLDVRSLTRNQTAAGRGAASAVGRPVPIPNLRFGPLLDQARSVTENVIRLGSALLEALRAKDEEALARLRITQESQLLNLTTRIRQQQVEAVDLQRAGLESARSAAVTRRQHYRGLLDHGLLPQEVAQVTLLVTSGALTGVSAILRTASAFGFAIPQVGSPFAMTYGGEQVGSNLAAAAAALDTGSSLFQVLSSILGLYANQERRAEDWTLQETLAGFDVAQLDAQLDGLQVQRRIAEGELAAQLAQIDQTVAVFEFYQNRFTSEELYQWMAGRLAATYFQTYVTALDLARMAERAFQFELRTDLSFVSGGNWDDLHRGLTAGEGLMLALDQLSAARTQIVTRRLEITKTISLARLDPIAFLSFVRTGTARFELDERLFDVDFPGHYQRRIKTVSVSIPALVGPYQNIHATLVQTANREVLRPDARAVQFLLGADVAVPEGTLEHNVRVNQRVALSAGTGDAGVFEVALDDPLYLPFEGTGAVSSWTLSMPPENNAVRLGAVSDVVVELRYTALDGGDSFRQQVAELVRERDWTSLIQPARQDPAAWHAFLHGPLLDDQQRLVLRLAHLDPPNVDGSAVTGLVFRLAIPPGVSAAAAQPYVTVTVAGEDPVRFAPDKSDAYVIGFERPLDLPPGPLDLTVDFDLRSGRTPAGLRTEDGTRLDPAVVLDIDLVVFLTGTV